MSLTRYRTNRKDLRYDSRGQPIYNLRLHIKNENVDVTMSRRNGRYVISDAIPCSKKDDCFLDGYYYRVTFKDSELIEYYVTAFFKRLEENSKNKLSSIRNKGEGLSELSETIPKPIVKKVKKS